MAGVPYKKHMNEKGSAVRKAVASVVRQARAGKSIDVKAAAMNAVHRAGSNAERPAIAAARAKLKELGFTQNKWSGKFTRKSDARGKDHPTSSNAKDSGHWITVNGRHIYVE